jgi:hypothetical protein
MPMFECAKCGSGDNTATSDFWENFRTGAPPLCSACDPETGKWHEEFPRVQASELQKQEAAADPSAIWYKFENGVYYRVRADGKGRKRVYGS